MKKLFFGYFLYNDVVVFKVFNRNHNDSRQKIKINKQNTKMKEKMYWSVHVFNCMICCSFVPHVPRALHALVSYVPPALRALVPQVPPALLAFMLHVPRALLALVPYNTRAVHALVLALCFTCLVLNVLSCLTCLTCSCTLCVLFLVCSLADRDSNSTRSFVLVLQLLHVIQA